MVYILSAKSINAQRPETRICCSPDRRKQPDGKDNMEQKCWQPVIKHSVTNPSGICWLVGTKNSLCTINQWKMFKINIFSKIKEKSVVLTASQRARYIYRRALWFNTGDRSKVKGACVCVCACVCARSGPPVPADASPAPVGSFLLLLWGWCGRHCCQLRASTHLWVLLLH